MKKIIKPKAEYIQRNKSNDSKSTTRQPGGWRNVGDLLGSLNVNQLAQVATSLSDAGSSIANVSAERERTKQVLAEVNLSLAKVKAENNAARLHFKEMKASLLQADSQDKRRHKEAMTQLKASIHQQGNEHEQVLKIIALVENKTIPAEELAQLINHIKAN